MISYRVVMEEKALKELKAISNPVKSNIFNKIKQLQSLNTETRNIKKIANYTEGYRLRVGNYRILFTKNDLEKTIKVYQIGHRKEIYR